MTCLLEPNNLPKYGVVNRDPVNLSIRLSYLGGETCSLTTQIFDMKNSIRLKAYCGYFMILFTCHSVNLIFEVSWAFCKLTLHLKLAINWVPA